VDRVEAPGQMVSVQANGVEWQGNILVGADGARSIVARVLGLGGQKKMAATLEVEIPISAERMEQYRGVIKIDYGIVPAGYAWIFPKSDHLSAGIWTISPRQKRLKLLLEKYLLSDGLFEPASRVKTRGWIIPVNHKLKDLHNGRAMVLGDAAGLADAFTGEGIFPALFSARMAAEVIAEQVDRPAPDLSEYTNLVRDNLGPELAGAFRLTRWVSPITFFIHSVLSRRQDLVRDFIEVASGDLSYTRFIQYFSQQLKTALHI
jgi:flavin-dependent dehydrogenase